MRTRLTVALGMVLVLLGSVATITALADEVDGDPATEEVVEDVEVAEQVRDRSPARIREHAEDGFCEPDRDRVRAREHDPESAAVREQVRTQAREHCGEGEGEGPMDQTRRQLRSQQRDMVHRDGEEAAGNG